MVEIIYSRVEAKPSISDLHLLKMSYRYAH